MPSELNPPYNREVCYKLLLLIRGGCLRDGGLLLWLSVGIASLDDTVLVQLHSIISMRQGLDQGQGNLHSNFVIISGRRKHASIPRIPCNGVDTISFVTRERFNEVSIFLMPDINFGVCGPVSITIAN